MKQITRMKYGSFENHFQRPGGSRRCKHRITMSAFESSQETTARTSLEKQYGERECEDTFFFFLQLGVSDRMQ